MFSRKKKEKKKADSEQCAEQQQPIPLSKDELKKLEETRNKLFAAQPQQQAKGENGQEAQRPPPVPLRRGAKPKPPPRPPADVLLKCSPPKPTAAADEEEAPEYAPPPPPPPADYVSPMIRYSRLTSNGGAPLSPASTSTSSSHDQEFEFGYQPLKALALPGVHMPALTPVSQLQRQVQLQRASDGTFGVSLRRAQLIDRATNESRTVIFAEPNERQQGMPTEKQLHSSVQPGDLLVAVNDQDVQGASREEVVALIKQSGDTLDLVVRPMAELMDFTTSNVQTVCDDDYDRELQLQTQSRAHGNSVSESPTSTADSAAAGERVWLMHKGGYAAAQLIQRAAAGEHQVKIRLDDTQQVMSVDSDDVEQANPVACERVPNAVSLLYLNECSLLHLLRERYGSNLMYTNAGTNCTLAINPVVPSTIYDHKFIHLFKGGSREAMPPHIYATAQHLYRQTQCSGRSQACVLAGRSGSGKTTQLRHMLSYLCLAAGASNKNITLCKLSAMHTVLDAFGCARTQLNRTASRFACLYTLDFDHLSHIGSASVQAMLLETPRVTRRPDGEGNFNVLHYLWRCADDKLRQRLQLKSLEPTDIAVVVPNLADESVPANAQCFAQLQAGLAELGVTDSEQYVLWASLAAILHVANARATAGTQASQSSFVNAASANTAAELLGCTFEQLNKAIFQSSSGGKRNVAASKAANKVPFTFRLQTDARSQVTERSGEGVDAVNAFCQSLYQHTFNLVLSLVNRALSHNGRTHTSITVLDCPGFQHVNSIKQPQSANGNGKQAAGRSGTLSDLCINYANERIGQLFYECAFSSQMQLYRHEQVDVPLEEPNVSPDDIVNTLDKPSKQDMMHSANIQMRSEERRGLLWLLDEECIFPGATDESFIERLFVHYGANNNRPASTVLRKSSQYKHFVLRHQLGSCPVHYNVAGWIKQAIDNPVAKNVLPLLHDSTNEELCSLYLGVRQGLQASDTTRRATQLLKTFNNPQQLKRRSYCALTKVQMDWLCECIRRIGRVHFVHCVLPEPNMAALNIQPNNPLNAADTQVLHVPQLDVQLLRGQLRGAQIVDAARFCKIGYPERMPYAEFYRRFGCLASGAQGQQQQQPNSSMLNYRQAVLDLLNSIGIEPNRYRIGLSQLFVRSDLLHSLEQQRVACLNGVIVGLQSLCRSLLAKRQVQRRHMQQRAIQCIQKNIKKYMQVKEWAWWRLYTRVLPLLGVMQTDGQLKNQADTIEQLRARCALLEKQANEKRLGNDRLDVKLSQLTAELAEERQQALQASEALTQESASNTRLAAQMAELRTEQETMRALNEQLQAKCEQYDQLLADDDDEQHTAVNGDAHERLMGLKQRVQGLSAQQDSQRREADQRVADVHKKLAEVQAERDELTEQVEQQRRRTHKAQQQLEDTRHNMQSLTQTNTELERKHKRFDSELAAAKAEADGCRQQRDKYVRESEQSLAKYYTLQQQLRQVQDDYEAERRTAEQLKRDLSELQASASSETEQELLSLRRAKQELDQKVADQEAELDDQAGQIQQLEAAQTRLHMAQQRDAQVSVKELEGKEQELEELRSASQRIRRSLEQQLEDEQEEKTALQRHNRELEIRLQEANQRELVRDESYEAQLKRDLRRTKALLKDAQAIIQQQRQQGGGKTLIKQLQNQLEDSEAARLASLKARSRAEEELVEVRSQLEQSTAARNGLEDRLMGLLKEKNTLSQQVEEHSEEWQELLKKYKAQVQQSTVDAITLNEQQQTISDLERQCEKLKEQATEAQQRNQWQEAHMVDRHKLHLADSKIRELENRADLAEAAKARALAQQQQIQAQLDELRNELSNAKAANERLTGMQRRGKEEAGRQAEQLADAAKREADATQKAHELVGAVVEAIVQCALERTEQEHASTLGDLKLALRRVDALQAALRDELELDEEADDDDDDDTNHHADQPQHNGRHNASSATSTEHSGAGDCSKWSDVSSGIVPMPRPRATSTPSVEVNYPSLPPYCLFVRFADGKL